MGVIALLFGKLTDKYAIVLTGHVLLRLDLSNMTHYSSPMPGKSRAYFEAISLLPKHVEAVLINYRCIGYMQADHS